MSLPTPTVFPTIYATKLVQCGLSQWETTLHLSLAEPIHRMILAMGKLLDVYCEYTYIWEYWPCHNMTVTYNFKSLAHLWCFLIDGGVKTIKLITFPCSYFKDHALVTSGRDSSGNKMSLRLKLLFFRIPHKETPPTKSTWFTILNRSTQSCRWSVEMVRYSIWRY